MTPSATVTTDRSLDIQRSEFSARRFLAMPLAGSIAWIVVGVSGMILPSRTVAIILFIATGMIAYLGMFISRLTGENFLDKTKPKNTFDALFFYTVAMSLLVYAIGLPFYLVDHTSLPLSVGILTGLMWLPFSWIIQHWVGIFHSVVRTVLILALWYAFPQQRFVVIPFAIVAVYAFTIAIFEQRWRRNHSA
ncbi:MAG: hypothetical protein JNN25_02125 [Candidatus Kapabacteria bacterium]|nr:hypothetical protein [Candidatus Kapabacteria bacterium]